MSSFCGGRVTVALMMICWCFSNFHKPSSWLLTQIKKGPLLFPGRSHHPETYAARRVSDATLSFAFTLCLALTQLARGISITDRHRQSIPVQPHQRCILFQYRLVLRPRVLLCMRLWWSWGELNPRVVRSLITSTIQYSMPLLTLNSIYVTSNSESQQSVDASGASCP